MLPATPKSRGAGNMYLYVKIEGLIPARQQAIDEDCLAIDGPGRQYGTHCTLSYINYRKN